MFTLQRLNVVRIVETESKRDELISKGFVLQEGSKPQQQEAKPVDKMNLEQLTAFAAEKGINISGLTKKDDIKERIKTILTLSGMNLDELKAYAITKKIDISDITDPDVIKERIMAAEQEKK
jgi:hypothetical protein